MQAWLVCFALVVAFVVAANAYHGREPDHTINGTVSHGCVNWQGASSPCR